MKLKNRENFKKRLMIFLAVGLLAASITAVSAWSALVYLNAGSEVTSDMLTGKTSYNVAMDVQGRAGLQYDHTMYTKMYVDDHWWPFSDTLVWSYTDNMDYSKTVSNLNPSQSYYVVWTVGGTTNVNDWTTLTFQ